MKQVVLLSLLLALVAILFIRDADAHWGGGWGGNRWGGGWGGNRWGGGWGGNRWGGGWGGNRWGGGWGGNRWGGRWGGGYWRRDLNNWYQSIENLSTERVVCNYYEERQFLSCSSQSAVIECDAIANFTDLPFEFFAIERTQIEESQDVKSVRFWLYPRSLDNKFWLNSTLYFNNEFRNYSIYYSNTNIGNGFRISDLECYSDLVELFRLSRFEYEISLEKNILYRFSSDQVTIAGDILVV